MVGTTKVAANSRRYKAQREHAEPTDYAALVPMTPPEGLEAWTVQHDKKLQKNVLIYRADSWEGEKGSKQRCVRVYCSGCGQTMTADYIETAVACHNGSWGNSPYAFRFREGTYTEPISGFATVLCPRCGCQAETKYTAYTGYGGGYFIAESWPMTVGRVGNRLVLTVWRISREVVHKDGAYRTEQTVIPWEAYIAEDRKIVRMDAYERNYSQCNMLDRWKVKKKFTDGCGAQELIFPWDKRILRGTSAENCKLDLYLKTKGEHHPVGYLNCWVKKPAVENLLVQGAGDLFAELLRRRKSGGSYSSPMRVDWKYIVEIDWTQRRPAQMLRLTRDELRVALREKIDAGTLIMWQALKAAGVRLRLPEDLRDCRKQGRFTVQNMIKDGCPVLKTVRYLNRQRNRYPHDRRRAEYSELKDYWGMKRALGEELTTEADRYPQHLTAAHDEVLARQKFKESEELKAKFVTVYDRLSPLAFDNGFLMIRPCKDESELIREGKALHHCVARYAKTHAEGKHCIFFIRRKNQPNSPYFTLELDVQKQTVLQNRGLQNCARTAAVKAFEGMWLEHIRGMRGAAKAL